MEGKMQPGRNAARRLFEDVLSHGLTEILDEICTPGFRLHEAEAGGGEVEGIDGLRRVVNGYRAAIPDLEFIIQDQFGDGDRIATRWLARGTHRGQLMGVAPTGRRVQAGGITISRLEGDRLAENWVFWDIPGLMRQLKDQTSPSRR